MKNIKFLFLLLLAGFIIISCENESESYYKTQKISRNDIGITPGFNWFEGMIISYEVTPSLINEIKSVYNKDKHKFLFVNTPSCYCDKDQEMFPYTTRILDEIGLPDSNFIFYAINDLKADFPYKHLVTLESFPSIYLMKDNEIKYFISDTLKKARNGRIIEEIVLDALKNNQ